MTPKFSLQNILDIRHGKVELMEIELGKLLVTYQKSEGILEMLKKNQAEILHRLNTNMSGEIDLVEMNFLRSNNLQLSKLIEKVTLELVRQFHEVEKKRSELIQAKQDEETLEILKEKQNEIYKAEQIQVEIRMQDDIYIARAFQSKNKEFHLNG